MLPIYSLVWYHLLVYGLITKGHTPGSHQEWIASQIGMGKHEALPLSMLECWLAWSGSCAGNHSCCKFTSAADLSCPGVTVLPLSSPSSCSYNLSAPLLQCPLSLGKGMIQVCHWWCSTHHFLFSAFWPLVSFSVTSHQQHKDAFLMRIDSCINVWT